MTCIFYIGLICCTVFYYMIHESRKRNCKLLTNSTLYDKIYVGMYTVLSMAQHNRYYVVFFGYIGFTPGKYLVTT